MRLDYTADGTSLPVAFERIAHRYAARVAVSCRLGTTTYGELERAASRVCRHLSAIGGAGARTAILMPQDRRIFAAILGVLKAGRIAVVLNGRDPDSRIRQLLADAEPDTILTVGEDRLTAERIAGGIAVIDIGGANEEGGPDDGAPGIGAEDTAFLVYTSGSTGEPKGVMQTHGHTLRDSADARATLAVGDEDKVLLLASLWGAQAVSTTFIAFLAGAELVSFPAVENGVTGLAAVLEERQVSLFVAASSLFRHFVKTLGPDERFPSVRFVKLSADAATDADYKAVRRHFPEAVLVNVMGCSEVGHLTCAFFPPEVVPKGRLPVGRPFPGVELTILGADGTACAPGVVGTISARIRYAAAGYWRDPEMTARHFFDGPDGTRIFRGGDIASMDAEGRMTLAGRSDATYKIRGQRVDLAEVERGIARLPGVAETAVVAVPRPDGDHRLVACVVGAADGAPLPRMLSVAARASMPRHHVPASFVVLDALPRTANGKVDRGRLRATAPAARGSGEPPATGTEALLARLWGETLELETVGRSDDFFDLGGDSLSATVVAARLHGLTGIAIDLAAFAEHPRLHDLAAHVAAASRGGAEPPLVPARRDRPVPIALIQEPYWWGADDPARTRRHHRVAIARISGPVDADTVRRGLEAVTARHEILRTRLMVDGPLVVQMPDPPGMIDLPLIDLTRLPDAEERLEELARAAVEAPFDLAAEPGVRFALARLAPDDHALIVSSHHIVTDGPSWTIFVRDFAEILRAIRDGTRPSLPPLPVQYADFSVWERKQWDVAGEPFRQAAAWWRREFARAADFARLRVLAPFVRRGAIQARDAGEWIVRFGLDRGTTAGLERLRREEGATYYMVRLALVVPLLSAATGHETVAVGGSFTNRTRPEVQGLFGPFGNIAMLVLTCNRGLTFRGLVRHVRRQAIAARRFAEVPYAHLARVLAAEGGPVPAPFFWVHLPTAVPPVRCGGLDVVWSDTRHYPRQDGITFRFNEADEQAGCCVMFDNRLYAPRTMRGLSDCLAGFTRAAAARPDATVGALVLECGMDERLRELGERARSGHCQPA